MTVERLATIEELVELQYGLHAVRRLHRQRTWRRAVQLRTTRIAMVLRCVQQCLGAAFLRREKRTGGRWAVLARHDGAELVAALVGGGRTRTLDEVRAPVAVEIIAPSLFDVDILRQRLGEDSPVAGPEVTQ